MLMRTGITNSVKEPLLECVIVQHVNTKLAPFPMFTAASHVSLVLLLICRLLINISQTPKLEKASQSMSGGLFKKKSTN